MLQKFMLTLLVEAARNEQIREFVADQVARLATKLKEDLLPDVAGLFPAFGASLVKTVFEKLPNVADLPGDVAQIAQDSVQNLIESDPDIPGLSDVIDLSEIFRRWMH
jgi:hypothetical protein